MRAPHVVCNTELISIYNHVTDRYICIYTVYLCIHNEKVFSLYSKFPMPEVYKRYPRQNMQQPENCMQFCSPHQVALDGFKESPSRPAFPSRSGIHLFQSFRVFYNTLASSLLFLLKKFKKLLSVTCNIHQRNYV